MIFGQVLLRDSIGQAKLTPATLPMLFLVAVVCGVGLPSAFAKQDPFTGEPVAESTTESADVTAPVASAGKLPPNDHPIVQSIREDPPKTPSAYAKAILYLSRIEQWDELGRYLDEMAQLKVSDEDAARMVTEVGLAEWVTIRTKGETLTEAQKNQITRVLDSAAKYNRAPAVLDMYLEKLRSPKLTEQKRGLLGLQSAGDVGIAHLVQHVMTSAQSPIPSYSAVVQSFEDQGIYAVQAAMMTNDAAQRERLFQLIQPLNSGNYILEFLGACHSTSDTDQTRKIATAVLTQVLGNVPSAEKCQATLNARLKERLQRLRTAEQNPFPPGREDWRWNGQALTFTYGDERQFELNRCMQIANSLRLASTSAKKESAEAFAVFLENESRITTDVDAATLVAKCESWGPGLRSTPKFLQLTWQAARQHGLFGAQKYCALLLGQLPEGIMDATAIGVLKEASESGIPAVRYQAAVSLMPIMVKQELSGTSSAQAAIGEMLRLQSEALVLVIGTNPSLNTHSVALLNQVGYRVIQATSGVDAIRIIQEPHPIEFILVVDRTGDIAVTQLVQKLRSHYRGSTIPVAMLLPEYRDGELKVLNEVTGLIGSFVPPDEDGMLAIIKECNSLPRQRVRLTDADRLSWKTIAGDFLNAVASKSSSEVPANLQEWSAFARSTLTDDTVSKMSNDVLAEMGDGQSQRELTKRLVNPDESPDVRESLSGILSRSIRFHGVQMTRTDVENVYKAYNTQAPRDVVAHRVLGSVLDEIETYAKENGWDSIASEETAVTTKKP
jgi:CheY-like chemotaxis protein